MTTHLLGPSSRQIGQYERDGYFLLENLLSPADIQPLLRRLDEYASGQRTTPGVKVSYEAAVNVQQLAPQQRATAVRKIKDLVPNDDLFTGLVLHPRIVAAMQEVLGPDVKLFRDAVLMKPARVGSAKGVHQDSPYWPIEPMDLASCWIAFDPATTQNGCMLVIPGSHRRGHLEHVEDPRTRDYIVREGLYDPKELIPVEMPAGTGLVFHSLLIHATAANTSPNPRRAITLSYMPAASRYTGKPPKPEFFRISGADRPEGV